MSNKKNPEEKLNDIHEMSKDLEGKIHDGMQPEEITGIINNELANIFKELHSTLLEISDEDDEN